MNAVQASAVYGLPQARHRFYAWTACRAAQAGSAKAKRSEMMRALETCGVVTYLAQPTHEPIEQSALDLLFYDWVEAAMRTLGHEFGKPVSFGIAAKLISVYAKGIYVLHAGPDCKLAERLHPPIDSLLLKGIDARFGTKHASSFKWQKLDRSRYIALITQLRHQVADRPFWHLEEHWEP